VVRNQHDEIIAIQDLEGTIQKTEANDWTCEAYYEIDVPEATFYTVYLGDERIVGYAADDFPISFEESPRLSL
jgi:hypothetical protein